MADRIWNPTYSGGAAVTPFSIEELDRLALEAELKKKAQREAMFYQDGPDTEIQDPRPIDPTVAPQYRGTSSDFRLPTERQVEQQTAIEAAQKQGQMDTYADEDRKYAEKKARGDALLREYAQWRKEKLRNGDREWVSPEEWYRVHKIGLGGSTTDPIAFGSDVLGTLGSVAVSGISQLADVPRAISEGRSPRPAMGLDWKNSISFKLADMEEAAAADVQRREAEVAKEQAIANTSVAPQILEPYSNEDINQPGLVQTAKDAAGTVKDIVTDIPRLVTAQDYEGNEPFNQLAYGTAVSGLQIAAGTAGAEAAIAGLAKVGARIKSLNTALARAKDSETKRRLLAQMDEWKAAEARLVDQVAGTKAGAVAQAVGTGAKNAALEAGVEQGIARLGGDSRATTGDELLKNMIQEHITFDIFKYPSTLKALRNVANSQSGLSRQAVRQALDQVMLENPPEIDDLLNSGKATEIIKAIDAVTEARKPTEAPQFDLKLQEAAATGNLSPEQVSQLESAGVTVEKPPTGYKLDEGKVYPVAGYFQGVDRIVEDKSMMPVNPTQDIRKDYPRQTIYGTASAPGRTVAEETYHRKFEEAKGDLVSSNARDRLIEYVNRAAKESGIPVNLSGEELLHAIAFPHQRANEEEAKIGRMFTLPQELRKDLVTVVGPKLARQIRISNKGFETTLTPKNQIRTGLDNLSEGLQVTGEAVPYTPDFNTLAMSNQEALQAAVKDIESESPAKVKALRLKDSLGNGRVFREANWKRFFPNKPYPGDDVYFGISGKVPNPIGSSPGGVAAGNVVGPEKPRGYFEGQAQDVARSRAVRKIGTSDRIDTELNADATTLDRRQTVMDSLRKPDPDFREETVADWVGEQKPEFEKALSINRAQENVLGFLQSALRDAGVMASKNDIQQGVNDLSKRTRPKTGITPNTVASRAEMERLQSADKTWASFVSRVERYIEASKNDPTLEDLGFGKMETYDDLIEKASVWGTQRMSGGVRETSGDEYVDYFENGKLPDQMTEDPGYSTESHQAIGLPSHVRILETWFEVRRIPFKSGPKRGQVKELELIDESGKPKLRMKPDQEVYVDSVEPYAWEAYHGEKVRKNQEEMTLADWERYNQDVPDFDDPYGDLVPADPTFADFAPLPQKGEAAKAEVDITEPVPVPSKPKKSAEELEMKAVTDPVRRLINSDKMNLPSWQTQGRGNLKQAWHDAVRKFDMSLAQMYSGVEEFEKIAPKKKADSGYSALRRLPGLTGYAIESKVNPYVEDIARTLKEGGIDFNDAEDYAYAVAALERNTKNTRDKYSGLSQDDAEKIIKKIEKNDPKRKSALKHLVEKVLPAMNNAKLNSMVEAGLLPKEVAEAWKEKYKFYVPMKNSELIPIGVFKELALRTASALGSKSAELALLESTAAPSGERAPHNLVRGNGIPRAKGRKSAADYPLSWAVRDAVNGVVKAERAKAQKLAFEWIKANEAPEFIQVSDPITKEWIQNEDGSWESIYKDKNGKETDGFNESPEKGRVVMMIDNKLYMLQANRSNRLAMDIITGMNHQDVEQMGIFFKVLQKMTNFQSGLLTRWNPLFPLNNTPRDIQGALAQSFSRRGIKVSAGVLKNMLTAIKDAMAGKFGADTELYKTFRKHGGKIYFLEPNQLQDIHQRLVRATSGTPGVKERFETVKNTVELMNDVMENAVRLAYFKSEMDAMPKGLNEADQKRYLDRAALNARDITVDFNAKGSLTNKISAFHMFFNPGAQSMRNMIKNFTESKASAARTAAVYTLAAMFGYTLAQFNRILGGDDEETGYNRWDMVPGYAKATKIMLDGRGMRNAVGFGSDQSYATIPLVYGGAGMFMGFGQMFEGMLNSEHPDKMEHAMAIAKSVMASSNPLGESPTDPLSLITPTVLTPIKDIAVNEDWRGMPIAPEGNPFDKTEAPDVGKFRKDTPEFYKWLAKTLHETTGGSRYDNSGLDFSPELFRYLVNFYGGAVLKETERAALAAGKIYGGEEPLEAKEKPILQKYIFRLPEDIAKRNVYDRIADLETTKKKAGDIKKEEGFDPYFEFKDQNYYELKFLKRWNKLTGKERKWKDVMKEGNFDWNPDKKDLAQEMAPIKKAQVEYLAKNFKRYMMMVNAAKGAKDPDVKKRMETAIEDILYYYPESP